MTETNQSTWVWERTDEKRSGSSGDVAKIFKNEGTKQPGAFAIGAPRPEATLMAREVIQNSWDAARELRAELGDAAPDFEIEFIFQDHLGESKASLIEKLALTGLAGQLERVTQQGDDARSKIGLGSSNVLDRLTTEAPLKLLTIVERGTTGMYGPFIQARSKLFLALISVGYTVKAMGSGGSYGYGKAGLIAASATRTVLAYTCFREQADDPGVTRRLLGMTYWGQHEVGVDSFTGFARFGDDDGTWVKPFVNEDADAIALSLGLDERDPSKLSDLGTTFVLVDPEVAPAELQVAIGRNWWPAMLDEAFHPIIRHIDASGAPERLDVRPRKDPLLQSFIRGWELATTQQDNALPTDYRKDLGNSPATAGSLPLGCIGLHADLGGWSYSQVEEIEQEDDDEAAHVTQVSLVALLRGPRMVVEYYPYGAGKQPFVRGVFVASESVDDLLRQTEPKAHDAWLAKGTEEGVDPRAPIVAAAVIKKIRESVREFQKRLKPPPPDPGDVRLPVFQELFRNLMTGKGPGRPKPPPSGPRDVSVHVRQKPVVAENGVDVMLTATVDVSLATAYTISDDAPVAARFGYKFLEDGAAGEKCQLSVVAPDGFVTTDGTTYRGQLGRTPVRFELQSATYSADWSGRLVVTCDVDNAAMASQAAARDGEA